MIVSIVLMSISLILMVVFLYGKLTNYSLKTTIVKGVTSSLFVALAIYLFCIKGYPRIGIFFIVASFIDLLGDIVLGFKRVFPNKDKLFTVLGFVSFAIGHVIYVSGLYSTFYISGHFLVVLIPILISICLGFSIILIAKILKVEFGKLKIPAIIYVTVLTSLTGSSLALSVLYSFSSTFLIMVFVGGLFFITSDLILIRTYFGKEKKKVELISCTVTYYIAQFLIAFALMFL